MVKISNVRWTYEKMAKLNLLCNLITKKLKDDVKVKVSSNVVENTIVFNNIEPNKFILSIPANKIIMKDKDLRVKKLGRNFLETHKPTEKQYLGFFETIHKYLDELGLDADVEYVTRHGQSKIIRTGKVKVDDIPKLNTYPLEKE